MSLWSACMRVSRGPGRQRSQSSLFLYASPSRYVPLSSSHTPSVTHTHTHLAVFTWSLSLSNCRLPSISFPFSVSESLALLLSISPPQRHPPLLFSSLLHQIKGPGPRLSITLNFWLFNLSLGSMPADCSIIHTHLALPLLLLLLTHAKKKKKIKYFQCRID